MTMQTYLALAVGIAAVADDLWRRHIANWIPAAALAGGFAWQVGRSGWSGAWTALLGTAAGFAVFLVFFLLGGMGGGDVKLMAGFGALLGPASIGEAALWTAAVGGLMAVGALCVNAVRRRGRAKQPVSDEESKKISEREGSIPYAPAIALGVWLTLIPKT